MTAQEISIQDLQGANETLTLLVDTLRQLRSHGISPQPEVMVASVIEDDSAMRALARASLLLVVAIQRLADR